MKKRCLAAGIVMLVCSPLMSETPDTAPTPSHSKEAKAPAKEGAKMTPMEAEFERARRFGEARYYDPGNYYNYSYRIYQPVHFDESMSDRFHRPPQNYNTPRYNDRKE